MLDHAVIDMWIPVFTHRQLYTTLSYIRSRKLLQCLFNPGDPEHPTEDDHLTVKNVMFNDLLL